jgi:hypothetical protein
MRRLVALCLGILIAIAFSGCATIVTTVPEAGNDTKPNGIRVYPPRVYFFVNVKVDEKKNPPEATVEITRICLPDYKKGYDVKPRSILSKNYFSIALDRGQIVALNSNMDSTAMVGVIKAAISAGKTLLPSPIKLLGIGGKSMSWKDREALIKSWKSITGIYRLEDNNVLTKLNPDPSEMMPQ